ncbi:hypothetical protein OXX79_004289 [Metschnikowia pulcherrima]
MSSFTFQRSALLMANRLAAEGSSPFKLSTKLDSSLKKNISFIKKIKGINAESAANIIKEISSLSLEKYLSEIIASLAEGLLKLSRTDDINAGILVVSALFQRFGDQVAAPLLSYLVNAIVERDTLEPALKQKTALKIVFEMHILGIGASFAECAPELLCESANRFYAKMKSSVITVTLIKDLMSFNLEQGYALATITTFLRRFASTIQAQDDIIPGELQKALLQLLVAYTKRVLELRQEQFSNHTKLDSRNKKASIRTGKIMREHQDLVDNMRERIVYFETHAKVLCDLLSMEYPALEIAERNESQPGAVEDNARKWWQDAKEQGFYQDVPNYKDVVESFDREKLPEAEYGSLSEGQKVNLFTTQLENLLDAKDLELTTMVMHMYIPYNKATKNRIIKFFTEIKKTDNVNLYARFLKMNAEFFPEVISELIESLDRGFRSQIRFDTLNFRNLAFFIELVKFKLIPSHIVFHKIRRMTLNIAGTSNVDILSVFYERCGKFLLFEPEYSETTKEMLQLLHNQAKSDKLTITEKLSLSNMFLIVDSFTADAPKQISRPVMTALQDFVHQIVKKLVTPNSYQAALDLFSDVGFAKNTEVQDAVIDLYVKPENLSGDRFKPLAELLLWLGKSNRRVPITIADVLTEKVIRGLELNDYRQNIARIAQVKMFAAMANAKVISFKSIIDLLYKLVCLGYPNNLPVPSGLEIDPRDNCFRVQLVCALIGALNLHAVKKAGLLTSGVKTAEGFLVFLQYYTFCKMRPLPKDVEFSLSAVFKNFNETSKVKIIEVKNFSDAMQALQTYTTKQRQAEGTKQSQQESSTKGKDVELVGSSLETISLSESEDSDSDNASDTETVSSGVSVSKGLDSENEYVNGDEESEAEDAISDYEEEEEEEEAQQALQLRKVSERKDAQNLDDEIKKLLNAPMHHTKSSVPLRMPAPSAIVAPQATPTPTRASEKNHFKFLSKSNIIRDLALPSNNKFTERIASEQAAQEANRRKIISLVDSMYENN